MADIKSSIALVKALLSNPQIVMVKPSLNLFLVKYMGKFHLLNVDGQLIIQAHLPSISSKAFTRFINEHLLAKTARPSHAQIGLTNACPQSCRYCYNKNRKQEADFSGVMPAKKALTYCEPVLLMNEGFLSGSVQRRSNFDVTGALFVQVGAHSANSSPPLPSYIDSRSVKKTLTGIDKERLNEGVDICREILERCGIRKDNIFLGTINAGHPGGMLPLTRQEA